ncbi:MAG: STAS domain-containing protein [Clostridia bacterium]|nr:STAS domain-containing protein [Clostridia bacterium]
MNVTKAMDGNKLTIAVEGRLDTNTAPELQKEITNIGDVDELVFDFSNLVYISSAGLRVLMIAQKGMSSKGGVKVINASEDVKEIFDITGFSSILTVE